MNQPAPPLIASGVHVQPVAGEQGCVGQAVAREQDGTDIEIFDLHALRRIRYIGVTFRTRTADEVGVITEAVERDLWPALREGKLRKVAAGHFAVSDRINFRPEERAAG